MYLPLTSSTNGQLSPYLHPGTWVLTSGFFQLWDESARMKVQRWKCEDESVRMKVWGWKCEDESARMKVRGWKCEDESVRMKVRGWKCGDENAEDEKSEDEKARGWKTGDESERMKNPRMKCHAAGSIGRTRSFTMGSQFEKGSTLREASMFASKTKPKI